MIERNYESTIWEDEAKTCTECGACTTICPTCHCFTLADEKEEDSSFVTGSGIRACSRIMPGLPVEAIPGLNYG